MASLVAEKNMYKRHCVEQMKRAELLQADLDRIDDLHAVECAGYKARIEELESALRELIDDGLDLTNMLINGKVK